MNSDEKYIARCFELAVKGAGSVSPNPLVGCVIVHKDRIIGEGWHKVYGGPHAEVNAIHSVEDDSLLPSSTAYVNLEPCSHFGKTPPCADLLIAKKIQRVVISNVDTFGLVAGSGIARMVDAGIEVITGVLEDDGRWLNRRFFTYVEQHRPYIILKWAESSDGFISKSSRESTVVSSPGSRKLVHRWRSEEDGFLIGRQTAETDNPRLNVRDWVGRNPVRIVLDPDLKLSPSLHLFDQTQKTLQINCLDSKTSENLVRIKVSRKEFTQATLQALYEQKLQSVVIEGGSVTLQSFIDAGWWDEARVFQSPQRFESGVRAPALPGANTVSTEKIDGDTLSIYQNLNPTSFPAK